MLRRRLYLFVALFIIYPLESQGIIEDVHDILDITYHLGEQLFSSDHPPDEKWKNPDAVEFPLIRDKQKKVISQIKVVSRDIDGMVDKQSHYMAAFRETTMNSIISNSQAIMLFIRIERVRHRIDSMYRHMVSLQHHFELLEISTLLHMAKWFVDPNSESIGHLLNILHMLLMGNRMNKSSGLEIIAEYYQHAEQIALAIDSVNNFIEGNLQLLSKRNDIADTMNRISSRFQQMQQYETYQDKLETSTLLTFAEWTVSPNAYSVHHLMDRLNLMMFGGSDEKGNTSTSNNMLEMLANSYQTRTPLMTTFASQTIHQQAGKLNMLDEYGRNKTISSSARMETPIQFPHRLPVFLLAATIVMLVTTSPVVNASNTGGGGSYSLGFYAPIEIDAIRQEYISLEQSLWQHLNRSPNNRNTEQQLRKIIDSHRKFVQQHMQASWDEGKYEILNHYEWSLLERDIMQIDTLFGVFANYLKSQDNSVDINEQTLQDITESSLRNDKTFSMSRIFQDIELIMVKQTMYYRAMMASKEERCLNQQSTQQFLYSLYTDIALTELKGYTMMEFSWMILRVYGKGNFTQEAELMRNDFEKRTEKTVRLLREVMNRADRIVWRCDPQKYVLGKNYDEVTRLLQGYIENEVDMNYDRECWSTCEDYASSKNEGCFKDKFCARQERCSGNIHSCRRFDSDMNICPAPRDSPKRYEFIEYENGVNLGQVGFCSRGKTAVDSWWRYLFWHCTYCFCLCDDQYSSKTDRYFNLRETKSNINENKVVTGLRFTKQNRVFHLQIQEGQLLPRGKINESTLTWKPVDNYTLNDRSVRNNRDYYTLSYGARSVDLDDIHTEDNSFVVTGVRWRSVGAHLNLEARLSEFSFETGKLVNPQDNSFWKSNDNTDVSGDRRAKVELTNPDVPTRTKAKSVPDSRHNQYIEFSPTDVYKDASQSTVPFIDTQDVICKPPVPLAGIGIYHKGRPGYGGFLAPKLMTYDFTPHIRPPRRA